jgi:hypothetical protein
MRACCRKQLGQRPPERGGGHAGLLEGPHAEAGLRAPGDFQVRARVVA